MKVSVSCCGRRRYRARPARPLPEHLWLPGVWRGASCCDRRDPMSRPVRLIRQPLMPLQRLGVKDVPDCHGRLRPPVLSAKAASPKPLGEGGSIISTHSQATARQATLTQFCRSEASEGCFAEAVWEGGPLPKRAPRS
jgi:hypothetical protein